MTDLDFILSRRSIRKYTEQHVSETDVEDLIRAAMSAPSACNSQPWHFIVIREPELLAAIPKIHPYAAMTKKACVAILACAEPALEKAHGNWPIDVAAAVENLLLAAHIKGLGAVWCGIYPEHERINKFRRLLDIPATIVPFSLIPIGYPAEEKLAAKNLHDRRVYRDKWGLT